MSVPAPVGVAHELHGFLSGVTRDIDSILTHTSVFNSASLRSNIISTISAHTYRLAELLDSYRFRFEASIRREQELLKELRAVRNYYKMQLRDTRLAREARSLSPQPNLAYDRDFTLGTPIPHGTPDDSVSFHYGVMTGTPTVPFNQPEGSRRETDPFVEFGGGVKDEPSNHPQNTGPEPHPEGQKLSDVHPIVDETSFALSISFDTTPKAQPSTIEAPRADSLERRDAHTPISPPPQPITPPPQTAIPPQVRAGDSEPSSYDRVPETMKDDLQSKTPAPECSPSSLKSHQRGQSELLYSGIDISESDNLPVNEGGERKVPPPPSAWQLDWNALEEGHEKEAVKVIKGDLDSSPKWKKKKRNTESNPKFTKRYIPLRAALPVSSCPSASILRVLVLTRRLLGDRWLHMVPHSRPVVDDDFLMVLTGPHVGLSLASASMILPYTSTDTQGFIQVEPWAKLGNVLQEYLRRLDPVQVHSMLRVAAEEEKKRIEREMMKLGLSSGIPESKDVKFKRLSRAASPSSSASPLQMRTEGGDGRGEGRGETVVHPVKGEEGKGMGKGVKEVEKVKVKVKVKEERSGLKEETEKNEGQRSAREISKEIRVGLGLDKKEVREEVEWEGVVAVKRRVLKSSSKEEELVEGKERGDDGRLLPFTDHAWRPLSPPPEFKTFKSNLQGYDRTIHPEMRKELWDDSEEGEGLEHFGGFRKEKKKRFVPVVMGEEKLGGKKKVDMAREEGAEKEKEKVINIEEQEEGFKASHVEEVEKKEEVEGRGEGKVELNTDQMDEGERKEEGMMNGAGGKGGTEKEVEGVTSFDENKGTTEEKHEEGREGDELIEEQGGDEVGFSSARVSEEARREEGGERREQFSEDEQGKLENSEKNEKVIREASAFSYPKEEEEEKGEVLNFPDAQEERVEEAPEPEEEVLEENMDHFGERAGEEGEGEERGVGRGDEGVHRNSLSRDVGEGGWREEGVSREGEGDALEEKQREEERERGVEGSEEVMGREQGPASSVKTIREIEEDRTEEIRRYSLRGEGEEGGRGMEVEQGEGGMRGGKESKGGEEKGRMEGEGEMKEGEDVHEEKHKKEKKKKKKDKKEKKEKKAHKESAEHEEDPKSDESHHHHHHKKEKKDKKDPFGRPDPSPLIDQKLCRIFQCVERVHGSWDDAFSFWVEESGPSPSSSPPFLDSDLVLHSIHKCWDRVFSEASRPREAEEELRAFLGQEVTGEEWREVGRKLEKLSRESWKRGLDV